MNPTLSPESTYLLNHQLEDPTSSERKNLIGFLDSELRNQYDFSVAEEYPSLFRSHPGGTSLYLKKSGQIASHVGYVVRTFRHSFFEFKVGLIGSVVTHPSCRKEGLAKKLLQQALQKLKEEQCVLAVLWSDQPDFYEPLGFVRAGQEKDFRFEDLTQTCSPKAVSYRVTSETELQQVWQMYLKKNGALDRSFDEMKALVKIPKTELYVTRENEKVSSYLVIHKGADFTNYIHEWGGELSQVKENLISCKNQFYPDSALTLIAPFETDESVFRALASQYWVGSLGLIKVLDRNKLSEIHQTFLRKQTGEEGNLRLDSLTDEELILWIFGKDGAGKGMRLPFFLWGFDSI